MAYVADLLDALNVITGGRMVSCMDEVKCGHHPFVIWKSSGIYGKEVLEIPGLIHGDPNKEVRKVAVCMTMSELSIELAGATGVDAIVAHHPIADAARCWICMASLRWSATKRFMVCIRVLRICMATKWAKAISLMEAFMAM